MIARIFLTCAIVLGIATGPATAQQKPSGKDYAVTQTARVGGGGGFDYVYADADQRRLYIPRTGQDPAPRITVFDLDTLKQVGEIPAAGARGVTVDSRSHHGFGSSKPVVMWDAKTLAPLKTIPVDGNPDGILLDPFNQRVYVWSHIAPNATVINAKDGAVVGTIDLGGAPEQAVTDGKGRIYVDIEDKDEIAIIDAKTLSVTGRYSLAGKGGTPAGLAFDVKHHILFAACRNPATMVMLDANSGKIIATVPIGAGTDGATFNPATMEVFSSQGDGTLTIVKEESQTKFSVKQTVQTQVSAKTLTLDRKTNRIWLIAAEFGPSPPPATPGGRVVRGPMVPGSFSIISVSK